MSGFYKLRESSRVPLGSPSSPQNRVSRWVSDHANSVEGRNDSIRAHSATQAREIADLPPLPYPPDYQSTRLPEECELVSLPASKTQSSHSLQNRAETLHGSLFDLAAELRPLPASPSCQSLDSLYEPPSYQARPNLHSHPNDQNPLSCALYSAGVHTQQTQRLDGQASGGAGVHQVRSDTLASHSSNASQFTELGQQNDHRHRHRFPYSKLRVPSAHHSRSQHGSWNDSPLEELGEGPRFSRRAYDHARRIESSAWYCDRVNALCDKSQKLQILYPAVCRHPGSGKIAIFDYYEDLNHPAAYKSWQMIYWSPDYYNFPSDIRVNRPDIKRRLIFVEDASPQTINILGATFQINPEAFADHLHQSGYGNSKEDNHTYPEWDGLPSIKDHMSFQWYRPVLPLFPIKQSFRDGLLNNTMPQARCIYSTCGKTHGLKTTSNIWRKPWRLNPFPTTHESEDERFPMGWNERITLWAKLIEDCVYIIILMDPLPLVDIDLPREGEEGNETIPVRQNTGFLRPTAVSRGSSERTRQSGQSTRSRASGFQNPSVASMAASRHSASRSLQQPHQPPEILVVGQRSTYDAEIPLRDDHPPFAPFQQIYARGPSAVADDHLSPNERDFSDMIKNMRTPISTFEESYQLASDKGKTLDPLEFLFQAIHRDIDGLSNIIRTSIGTMRAARRDSTVVQENVWYWRELLNQFEDKIGTMSTGLEVLVQFIFQGSESSKVDFPKLRGTVPDKIHDFVGATLHRLDEMAQIVTASQDQVRIELQLIDSRRSIAEAESISKLTELAFVFIPITFAASIFSMQIKELGDGVPAYQFVLVAIAFVLLSYSVRLMIRSEKVVEFKRECFDEARSKANLEDNAPVPTRIMLKWAISRLYRKFDISGYSPLYACANILFAAAVLAAFFTPIITLWHRRMDSGLSAAITVIVLLLDALALWPVVSAIKNPVKKWTLQNLKSRPEPIRRRRRRKGPDVERMIGEPSRGPHVVRPSEREVTEMMPQG